MIVQNVKNVLLKTPIAQSSKTFNTYERHIPYNRSVLVIHITPYKIR